MTAMWPFTRRPHASPPEPDAEAAIQQAKRALLDARNLYNKMESSARRATEIKRVNHIADAVDRSIRGQRE